MIHFTLASFERLERQLLSVVQSVDCLDLYLINSTIYFYTMSATVPKPETTTEEVPPGSPSKDLILKYLSLAIDNSPKEVQPYLKKASPYIVKFADFVEKVIPVLEKIYNKLLELWAIVEPYRPQLLAPAFMGFIMCFFGGSFLTLIAAVEAWNMCGYESTVDCINMLIHDFKAVANANKEDDKKDDDGDGVADVLQVSNTQLLTRKTLLFLKVADPERISHALTGITAGGMAVVAALKLRVSDVATLKYFIVLTIPIPL